MKIHSHLFARSTLVLFAILAFGGCASNPAVSYKSRQSSDSLSPAVKVHPATYRYRYPWYEHLALFALQVAASLGGACHVYSGSPYIVNQTQQADFPPLP